VGLAVARTKKAYLFPWAADKLQGHGKSVFISMGRRQAARPWKKERFFT